MKIAAIDKARSNGSDVAAAIEDEIYRDLVETLFATKGAFGAGIVAGMLGPAIAWLSTGSFVYLGLLMMMSGLAGYRLAVFAAYAQKPAVERRKEARRWEALYAIGGIAFMTGVGLSAAVLFFNMHTAMVAYYGVIVMAGFTGTIASRNAARPWIVFGQAVGACTPLALVALLHFDLWYWGLAAILIMGMIAIKSTTTLLHSILEAALRNGYESKDQKKKFSLALNSMTHGLCMGDSNLSVTVINRRVFDFFGIVAAATPIRLEALAHAIGRSVNMSTPAIENFIERWSRHAAMKTANVFTYQLGERFFDFHCVQADAGGFVTVIEDVTAQKRALGEIERIARYDDLTGLPNRFQFQDTLREELSRSHNGGEAALLNIDLDRFKDVNDTLGHSIGDQLLVAVGKRLAQCVTPPNVVARLGGDEFCVLIARTNDAAIAAEDLAERILTQMSRPFQIDGASISIGASIGVAFAPLDATTPNELLKCSDLALYHTKEHGRGKAVAFTTDMLEALTRKREMESEMKLALEADEFVPFYQPVVDSRSGKVVALEALLRWRHPQRGMVPPLQFIPIAEETGLIVEIGAWVLSRACLDALALPSDIRISVNVAPRQFQQGNLPELVRQILDDTGLEPCRLELEITESTLLLEHEKVDEQLEAIAALGVRLAIDDFGTGYSSLSYLNQFAVHKVKIDRSFTCNALQSSRTQAIIGAVSMLARDLDMDIVAEGDETTEQLAFLARKGVYLIQGYFYSPPRPLDEVALNFHSKQSELSAA